MSVVWVVQENNNDFAPAEQFGEVRFLTRSDYRSMKGSRQNEEVLHDIRRFKSEYIAGTDYIMPVGNPVVVSLVMMAARDVGPKHKLLKWDGRRATYIPFDIDAGEL